MQYKLLLVRNRCKDKLDVTKGLNWFKENTPLDVVMVDEISTDFDVTTTEVSNATFKGVMCGEDIIPKLRTVVPEGKYHAVVFIYGNKLNGIRVNVAPNMPIYPGTSLIQLVRYNDNGKTLNHEIFHTFFNRLQRQQVMIEDPMDTYIKNSDLSVEGAVDTNREIALKLLSSYWDKVAHILVLSSTPVNNTVASTPVTSTQNIYKYFKASEVLGLKPEFVKMLDKARELAGIPFHINSGYRTLAHNEDVGGVEDSSHTKGLAVDLRARNSNEHFLITKGLMLAGFTRISKKYPTHIHVDMDGDKVQNVLF